MAKKKLEKNPFKVEDFKYLDGDLPQLVLGVKIHDSCFNAKDGDWFCTEYNFKPGRKWLKIAHQTAGLACHQHYLIGTILNPKSVVVLQKMHQLCDKWLDTNAGVFGLTLTEANEYQADLSRLFGVGCNSSWKDMEEAIYPIDCNEEFIRAFTDDPLPANLDGLIEWDSGWARSIGCINRWRLFVLGENSD